MVMNEVKTRPDTGPAILKPREATALLKSCDRRTRLGRRDSALLAILVGGGLRIGECCRLPVEGISFDDGRVRVTCRTSKQRTTRYRTVTLPEAAGRMVRDYIDRDAPRFFLLEGRHGDHLSTRQGRQVVTTALVRIGRGDLHCHSLRHSVGAWITRSGGIFQAARVLGHSQVSTTLRFYSVWDVADQDAAADKLADIWRPRGYQKGGAK